MVVLTFPFRKRLGCGMGLGSTDWRLRGALGLRLLGATTVADRVAKLLRWR